MKHALILSVILTLLCSSAHADSGVLLPSDTDASVPPPNLGLMPRANTNPVTSNYAPSDDLPNLGLVPKENPPQVPSNGNSSTSSSPAQAQVTAPHPGRLRLSPEKAARHNYCIEKKLAHRKALTREQDKTEFEYCQRNQAYNGFLCGEPLDCMDELIDNSMSPDFADFLMSQTAAGR